jgi:hypothetical protein
MAADLLNAMQIGGNAVEDTTVVGTVQEIALPVLVIDASTASLGPDDVSARFVYVSFEGAGAALQADDGVSVKPGKTGGALTQAQGLWIGAGNGVILNVTGHTHLLHNGTGAVGQVHISPLANQ